MKDFRARLMTVDESGNRLWVYSDTAAGPWRVRRQFLAWGLIALYLVLPWLRWNELPLLQLDFAHLQLILLGQIFRPNDLPSLIPVVVGCVLFFFAITSVYGRIWCGWGCPQTVFLEFIYRPIERWIEGIPRMRRELDAAPWSLSKSSKKILKFSAYAAVSFVIANSFLAYFVGSTSVLKLIQTNPLEHRFLFGLMLFVWAGFNFNFGWFREQMCTITCPYGRFQSILLDAQSWVVGYDKVRGEPRGKSSGGDCVDCNRCVQVCPTGIDIRNGIQLECINCLECADACDVVMQKIDKPVGLIRFMREASGRGRLRTIVYCSVSVILISVFGYRLLNRDLLQISLARQGAADFQVLPTGVENRVQLWLENKSMNAMEISFPKEIPEGHITMAQSEFILKPFERKQVTLFVNMAPSLFKGGTHHGTIRIESGISSSPKETHVVPLTLFGPQ